MTSIMRSARPARGRRVGNTVHLLLASVIAAGFGVMTTTPVLAQASYAVEDLGVLPGDTSSVAWAINANGDVVGWSMGPNGTRGFVYTTAGGMVPLPGLPNGRGQWRATSTMPATSSARPTQAALT
jgi:probable HAF family extracellular repeat protein